MRKKVIPARLVMLRTLAILATALFTFCPAFAQPAAARAGTIRFETISTEQGLPQSTVNAIMQDRQGYLWFATEGGLDQYDGYQFTAYQHDPDTPQSLSDNIVYSIYEDKSGELWVGTIAGLDRFDRLSGIFIHYGKNLTGSESLSGVTVTKITQDHSGKLWFGTDGNGLVSLDPASNRTQQYRHSAEDSGSLSNNSVFSLYVDLAGELWVGTGAGLDRFDPVKGSFVHELQDYPDSPLKKAVPVQAILEHAQGEMWIGTRQGLLQWDRAANHLTVYKPDPNQPNSLGNDSVSSIFDDSQGVLWVGTLKGLYQYDGANHTFVQYVHDPNNPSSLSSDYVRTIFEDRSDVLWIGTSGGGLNKYARSTQKFNLFTNQPGSTNNLSDSNIWTVTEDKDKNLWIGTFFSGLNKLDPVSGKVTIFQNDPANNASLSNNEIRAIIQDRNGILWIATERGGLNRLDPISGTFSHYMHDPKNPASLDSDNVFSLLEDRQGRLWVGTDNGGLNLLDRTTGTFTHYQHDDSLPASLSDTDVRAIYQDTSGALWVGTYGGLDLWSGQGNQFSVFRHDPANPASLSSDMVGCIYEDQNGTIWVGTFGGGLDRFDRNTKAFAHYTTKNGLPDDTVYGILGDPAGNLWLSTNKGVSKFSTRAGTFRNYDMRDGLQGNQFNPGAFFQAPDGVMFFGGAKGLNAFFPPQVRDNPIPPPVVITDFKEFNRTVQTDLSANASISLSYRNNFIAFDFAALDYNAPEKNQYAYKLEGVDPDWVQAGTRRYASYSNLQGGDYTFRVKASNNDGVWNEAGTSVRIHITPPFWQNWWFIGLACLVVGAGAFGVYRLRVRDIEARNRELTLRVDQRTHDLATLNAIAGVVNRSLDLKEVMQVAIEQTMQVTRMTVGSALLLDETTQELILIAYRGASQTSSSLGARWPLASALAGKPLDGTHPLVWNVATDYPEGSLKANLVREGVQVVVGVPLTAKEKMVGMLVLNTRTLRSITAEELFLLEGVGQQVGMAVENARLYEQAEQTAIAAERGRLARELHDSVTQLIYSLTLYAEAASEVLASGDIDTAKAHLHELRDTSQEALREMRLLIFELHRPSLEEGGLATALQRRLDAVERRGGMQAELQVEGREQLPRSLQAELYNIAHEALNNAIKHSHAGSVHIRLQFEQEATEMEITDDGIGFDPVAEGLGGGFGIPGMKERAEKIGGILSIVSAPGKGACVSVKVPMNPIPRAGQAEMGSP